MKNVSLTDFYNHTAFMKDVVAGEKIIAESDKQLAMAKPEVSDLKVGNIIVATGKGTYTKGIKGRIISINRNGNFLSFLIDWDYTSLKKNHCKTFERLQDIRLYIE